MAFFQQSRREPVFNAPASVLVLIAILLGLHAARVLLLAPAASDHVVESYALIASTYVAPDATTFDRFVRPFSYMFLHANWLHVGFNSVWLLAFGPVVARRFGGLAFYLFFILCGLGGAIGFVLASWGQDVGAIGASGAISGLMGAAFRMTRLREPYLDPVALPLQPLFSSQVLTVSALWMVLNAVTGITGLGTFGSVEAVAWQAHIGGYVAGLLLAGPFDRLWRRKPGGA